MFSYPDARDLMSRSLPAKMKVFAPDGETTEYVGWVGIYQDNKEDPKLAELFFLSEEGSIKILNKKVIVQNLETGKVIYHPRYMLETISGKPFLTPREVLWLRNNPEWPDVLELVDNPVDNGEDNDGLYVQRT